METKEFNLICYEFSIEKNGRRSTNVLYIVVTRATYNLNNIEQLFDMYMKRFEKSKQFPSYIAKQFEEFLKGLGFEFIKPVEKRSYIDFDNELTFK